VFLLDVANWVILKSKLGGTIQAVVSTLLHTKECYESSVTGCKHTARDEASITGQLDGQPDGQPNGQLDVNEETDWNQVAP